MKEFEGFIGTSIKEKVFFDKRLGWGKNIR